MRSFHDFSIRRKLMLIVLVTSSVALVLASAASFAYDLYTFRQAMAHDLTTVAEMIGSNSTAALTFHDPKTAREILAALRAERHVIAACIYGRDGQVFAKYRQGDPSANFTPPAVQEEGSRFGSNRLTLFRNILLDGEKIGTVYLVSDLSEMWARLQRYAVVLAVIVLMCSAVAYLVSSRLQRAISEPIRDLVWTAKMISLEKDYSLRAAKKSEDELGLLIEGFNEMLTQIQLRDLALLKVRDELEERVVERTAELQQEAIERKRAQGALRQSEELFRSVSASSPVGIFRDDAEGKCLYVNERWQEITGRTFEQALGYGWMKAIHPQDRQVLFESWRAQTKTGSEWSGDTRVLTPTGEVRWVHVRSRALHAESGAVIGHVGTVEDITERRKADTELEERTAYLNGLIENSPVAIVSVDVGGRLLMCNPAFEQLFQYCQKDIIGKELDELVAPGDAPDEPGGITQRVASGELVHRTTRRRRRDGTVVDVELHAVPLIVQGQFVGQYGLYQDITERKRAEEELQRAKEAAEAANRAKSEFLANMSHEIRTPMNGILGMAELALDTELTAEQREYLRLVKGSADSLLRVINDILDFSKIEAGKLDLVHVEFNLRRQLAETLKTLALRAHKKGLELAYQVAQDVPPVVLGDPDRLRQLVVNLVGNAIKFTEEGEVVVRVHAESKTQDSLHLHFAVQDTGMGIAPEKQREIFEPFAQADGSTTRRFGGTGLGLTISTRLVQLMGGRLWVESGLGRGSTFHFTLHFALPERSGVVPLGEAEFLEGLLVLVAEDNASNGRILEEILANWRMRPRVVDGGYPALRAMEQAQAAGQPFPLVVLDAQMPDLDGFAVAELIRERPELAGATILMLASDRQPGDAARCRELGVAAYLTKPISPSELLDAILVALGMRPPATVRSESLPAPLVRPAARSLRVLLAEDNAINQALAMRLLEKRGHQVMMTPNGREALKALEAAGPVGFDLVLMDVQMPEMDGFEATAAIREREKASGTHVPIVAMTAHAMAGDRERCLAAGMDGYIAKPIRAAELFAEIERHLRQPEELAATPPASAPTEPAPAQQLDRTALLERVEGDPGLLAEMVKLFLRDSSQLLGAIREGIARDDTRAVERNAHTLKGALSNLAASAAAALAQHLEKAGREAQWAQAEEACKALEAEMERLKPALAGLCQEVAR